MKSCRLLVVLAILLAALLACNLPNTQHPAPSVEPDTATPLASTLSPTPRPPTSTPTPQAWFIDVQDGQVLTAELHPDSRLPMVSLQIGFKPDNSGIARYFVLDADGMQVARVQNTFLDKAAASTTFNWTAWHGNGAYRLDLYKIDYGGRLLSQQTIDINVTGIPDDVPTLAQRFQAAYLQYFGLHLTAPVFAHYMVENPEVSNQNRWISAAYIGDMFYRVDIYDEIDKTNWTWRSLVGEGGSYCRPAGDYKILLVLVDYGNTTIDHEKVLERLAASEAAANQRWSDYSASIGLTTPILHTETTQTYLEAPPDLGEQLTVEQVKTLTGYDPADFDILVEVDLDLEMRVITHVVAQGNGSSRDPYGVALLGACRPGGAGKVNIIVDIDQPKNVDAWINWVVYDHELLHLFGWEHEWPNRDGSGPAQYNQLHPFPYTLFGWVDTNADGVIEILSDHPYGLLP
jgi:hypothetical protein